MSQGSCSLGQGLAEGQILCDKYSMTLEFRNEIIDAMRADIHKEIQATILKVRLSEMEKTQGFAG
jgi:hypothetical protein